MNNRKLEVDLRTRFRAFREAYLTDPPPARVEPTPEDLDELFARNQAVGDFWVKRNGIWYVASGMWGTGNTIDVFSKGGAKKTMVELGDCVANVFRVARTVSEAEYSEWLRKRNKDRG